MNSIERYGQKFNDSLGFPLDIRSMKLTEDEIVLSLKIHLETSGWEIGDNYRLGHNKGIDIKAKKGKEFLLVEVKGARANDKAHNKKRMYFDSGQIKDHFGKAIVKMLHEKYLNPENKLAIAHPDDEDIRRNIGHLIPFLKTLNIGHYWVDKHGCVIEE